MNNRIEHNLEYLINKIGERPVGLESNHQTVRFLEKEFDNSGYKIKKNDFDCVCWENSGAILSTSIGECEIEPGPFSKPFDDTSSIKMIETIDQLKSSRIEDKIVVLHGDIVKNPLMPKDFPFFYPDVHQQIIETLEEKNPKAIVAITGKHPFCGLDPFPLFNDGNFNIPNASASQEIANKMIKNGKEMTLKIRSKRIPGKGQQLIASKGIEEAGKVVICSHMDTAYNTPGALDNASGLVVILETATLLSEYTGPYQLEFVPFNGEDYFGVGGQLAYLGDKEFDMNKVVLAINIDSPGYIDSKTAVSFYNFNALHRKRIENVMDRHQICETGSEWIAGDHSIFAFCNIPTIAITSSNLLGEVMELTHTPRDTIDMVDPETLKQTASFLAEYIKSFPPRV